MNEWMLSKHLLKEDLSAGCQAEASLIVSDGGGKKGQADWMKTCRNVWG